MVSVNAEFFSTLLDGLISYALNNKYTPYIVLPSTSISCQPESSPSVSSGALPAGVQISVAVQSNKQAGSYSYTFSGTYTPGSTTLATSMVLYLPVGSNSWINTTTLCFSGISLQSGITYTAQINITITYPTSI